MVRSDTPDNNNAVLVRVYKLGSTVREVALPEGATVADAIKAAGLDATGCTPKVDGEIVEMTGKVEDGDTIGLFQTKIKAG